MPGPIKKHSTEGTKTKEEIHAEMNAQRTNKKPGPERNRPKGVHTPLSHSERQGVRRSEAQWAEAWERFFANLQTTCKVAKSCEFAGVSYMEMSRRRKADPEFEKRFQESYDAGAQALEDEAIRRAFEGVEKPVFFQGVQCGSVQEYSDQLMIFLLKGARPEKFKDRTQNENTNFNFNLANRLDAAKKRGEKE